MIREITVEQVIAIHRTYVRAGPLRDRDVLEGAVASPFQSVFGLEPYPTVTQKAVKLAEGISRAQAFVDGNKRLAWLSLTAFLEINGLVVCADEVEAAEWVLGLQDDPNSLTAGTHWLNERLDNIL